MEGCAVSAGVEASCCACALVVPSLQQGQQRSQNHPNWRVRICSRSTGAWQASHVPRTVEKTHSRPFANFSWFILLIIGAPGPLQCDEKFTTL